MQTKFVFLSLLLEGFLLFYLSQCYHRKTWQLLHIILAIAFIVGLSFRVMHWPYADIIIGISLGSIAIMFSAYFIRKSPKSVQDYLLLTWLLLCGLHHTQHYLRLPWLYWHIYPFSILLWVNVLYIFYLKLNEE